MLALKKTSKVPKLKQVGLNSFLEGKKYAAVKVVGEKYDRVCLNRELVKQRKDCCQFAQSGVWGFSSHQTTTER